MADRIVRAIITGDASGALKSFGEVSTAAESSGSKIGGAFKAAAAGAAVVVGAAVGIAAVAVKMATQFQQSQTLLVTGAGESQSNLAMVSQGILNMAGQVGQSAMSLSQGMFLIESAGYHGADGLAVLKSAAEGASVGGAQLTTVAGAVTTALHDYALPVSQANNVTSALIETVASGKTNLEDLGESLGRVLPTAAALGVSFPQVAGAMATMTNAGLSARFAAMHLQASLLALSAPSGVAGKAMKEVGLTTQEVKNTLDGPSGLSGALALIEEHVGKKFPAGSVASVTALKDIMGGTVGYSTALMLTGSNMAGFATNINNIGASLNGSGSQVQGFGEVTKDLGFQFQRLKDAVGAALIQFGTRLLPVVSAVMGWFATLLPGAINILNKAFAFVSNTVVPALATAFRALGAWVQQNRTTLLGIASVVGTIIVGAFKIFADIISFVARNLSIFGPILVGIGAGLVAYKVITFAVSAATKAWAIVQAALFIVLNLNPIGMIAIAIGALVIAIGLVVTHFTFFKGIAIDVWNAIKGVVIPIWNTLVGLFKITPFGFLITHLTDLKNIFVTVWNIITSVVKGAFVGVATVVSTIFGGIASAIKGAINGVIGIINFFIGLIDAIQVHIHVGPVGIDWNGLNLKKIPTLDTGGIITKPTLALLAANSKPEAVIPIGSGQFQGAGGGGAGSQPNVTIYVTSNDGQAVVNALKRYMYANGPLPITVNRARALGS